MVFAARIGMHRTMRITNYKLYVKMEYKTLLANPASSGAASYEVEVILSGTRQNQHGFFAGLQQIKGKPYKIYEIAKTFLLMNCLFLFVDNQVKWLFVSTDITHIYILVNNNHDYEHVMRHWISRMQVLFFTQKHVVSSDAYVGRMINCKVFFKYLKHVSSSPLFMRIPLISISWLTNIRH